MPQKRKSSTHDFPPSSSYYSNPKRPRPSPSPFSSQFKYNLDDDDYSSPLGGVQQPRLDPTYGQRGAFPGLDDDDDDRGNERNGDGLFYGPASDGFEYLRMVRLVVFWRVWLEFTNFLVFLDSKRKVYRSFWLRSLMILLLLLG